MNLWDVAFQKYVLTKAGVRVPDSYLVHLNRDYVYPGGNLNLKRLFVKADVNKDVRSLLKEVPSKIKELFATLKKKTIPKIEPGSHCKQFFDCPLQDYCTSDKPQNWTERFFKLSWQKKEQLRTMGIEDIRKIPEDFSLSKIQERIRKVLIDDRPYFDPEAKGILNGLKKPIHYLDFETFMPAIPIYPGTKPYDTIAFQWSLHIENGKGKPKHLACLADSSDDPRKDFLETLLNSVEPKGDILTYTNYETTTLRSLTTVFPKQARKIESLIDRCVDLCKIVRDHVYHPGFDQSFSLKTVLPALVPKLAYDDLDIQDGGTASRAFLALREENDARKKAKLRNALLDYCKRDTLGMFELKKKLTSATNRK